MDGERRLRRTAKDSVFTHLFSDKQYILQLYQALHPEDEGVTEDMIEVVTRQSVLVNEPYNDLGFTVGDRLLILAEAQSSWTENIIVRALLYVAATYGDIIAKQKLNIYGGRKISLPRPELYVVYTGRRKLQKRAITLAEEFFGGQASDLNVKVHVLRGGRWGDIVNQYVRFTRVYDAQVRRHGRTQKAAMETIRVCRDRHILEKFLREREWEVYNAMITLFSEEQIMEAYEKEVWDDGRKEGIDIGRKEGVTYGHDEEKIETAIRLIGHGYPDDLIMQATELSKEDIQTLRKEMGK